jgi:hypothetical protein
VRQLPHCLNGSYATVKKAKMSMERDIARDVKKNPKKFWKYANSKRKTKSGISELKTNTENGVKIMWRCHALCFFLIFFTVFSSKGR